MYNNSTWKARIGTCGILTFGTIVISAIALPYNILVTENAFLSPSNAYYNKYFWPNVMALGFGPGRGMHWGLDAFPGHSPVEAIVNAALNIFLLNTELFGWGIGSILLLMLLAVSGSISKKDLWAVVVIAAVIGAYSLFWYHGGPDFGARYWFLSIIPLIALTVRGVEWMSGSLSKYDEKTHGFDGRVIVAVGAMCLVSLLTYLPWRASDKYYHYLGMQPSIQQLAAENNFGKSLVIIRGGEHPDYQSAWTYNPVNFDGDAPIFAHEKNPQIYEQLLNNYIERPIWIVDGPTLTSGNYSIVRGPVNAQELLNGPGK